MFVKLALLNLATVALVEGSSIYTIDSVTSRHHNLRTSSAKYGKSRIQEQQQHHQRQLQQLTGEESAAPAAETGAPAAETGAPAAETPPPATETPPPAAETAPPAESAPPAAETTTPAGTAPPVFAATPSGPASCSANPVCVGLEGNCCPTDDGVTLNCCNGVPLDQGGDQPAGTVSSDSPSNVSSDVSSDLSTSTPADAQTPPPFASVVSSGPPPPSGPGSCSANPVCVGLEGNCCPTDDGVTLNCCNGIPLDEGGNLPANDNSASTASPSG